MTTLSHRRFLFLYSSTGAGHRAGALAVRDALQQQHGAEAEILLCDGLQVMGLWPFSRFPRWWPTMVRLRGIPWGAFYRLTNRPLIPATIAHLLLPFTTAPVARLLAEYAADTIVSFHPLFTHTCNAVLQRSSLPTPFASVVLDLVSIHAAWCTPTCARVFVPTEYAAACALAWGIAPEKLVCAGLPVHPRFAVTARMQPEAARAQLGLPAEGPVILVTGGGDAAGPLVRVIQAVAAASPHALLVVIAGNNTTLRRNLVGKAPNVRVEGFVENMDMWMRAATILLTKAGPNTLAEALVTGLPMVLYQAIPGQEIGNVDWVVSQGAALWAPYPKHVAATITALLNDAAGRAAMSAAALALAQPDAATTIGKALWQLSGEV